MSRIPAVAAVPEIAITSSARPNFRPEAASAVPTLNAAGLFGANREVTYSFDRATHLPVVRVLDIRTKEVIHPWPPEFALKLASGDLTTQTGDS